MYATKRMLPSFLLKLFWLLDTVDGIVMPHFLDFKWQALLGMRANFADNGFSC